MLPVSACKRFESTHGLIRGVTLPRENKETPLNCQEAVAKFKSAVVGVEKVSAAISHPLKQ